MSQNEEADMPTDLKVGARDRGADMASILAGAAPTGVALAAGVPAIGLLGAPFALLARKLIPKQRAERLVRFVQELEKRVVALEESVLLDRVQDERVADLVEDGVQAAMRALSEERIERLANLVAGAIVRQAPPYEELKAMLRMLEELSDDDVMVLFSHTREVRSDSARYNDLIERGVVVRRVGGSEEDAVRKILYKEKQQRLARLGLLDERVKADKATGGAQVNGRGGLHVTGYTLTGLGRVFLHALGMVERRIG